MDLWEAKMGGSSWEDKFEKRMQEMSAKMDSKFNKFDRKVKNVNVSHDSLKEANKKLDKMAKMKLPGQEKTLTVDGKKISVKGIEHIYINGDTRDVEVHNAREVHIKSAMKVVNQNGDVTATTVNGSIDNQNGDIKIDTLNGDGKMKTSNGDIIIKKQVREHPPIPKHEENFIPKVYRDEIELSKKAGSVIFRHSFAGSELMHELDTFDWNNYFYTVFNQPKTKPKNSCYVKD